MIVDPVVSQGHVQSFDKQHRQRIEKDGHLLVQFLDGGHQRLGDVKAIPVSTMTNLAFNLLSVQELVQQMGYKFLLQQDGFSGFVKVDPESGRVYEQLPVTYDENRRIYTMQYKAARHQENLAACTLCETCVPTFDEVELRHWVQAALACGAEIAAP